MTNRALNIGLLADNAEGLGELVSRLRDTSLKQACSVLMRAHSLPLRKDIDVWVLNISDQSADAELFLDWLHDRNVPHLILETGASKVSARGLAEKINEAFSSAQYSERVIQRPNRIWVLAASTGGPEALAVFLTTLGMQATCDAFIYVQHIEPHSFQALLTTVKANTLLKVNECSAGIFLEAGHIYVVDPVQAFSLSGSGRILAQNETWSGIYTPSIDQVIAKVARVYRSRSGAIVFSGMGSDGAASSRLMQALGGTIFTQSLDSCTVDSMPRSVIEQIDVAFSGTAEALANKVALCSEVDD